MARFFCALLLAITLLAPVKAEAADFRVNVSLVRQDDGTTLGELWYNDRVVWRLKVASDGAAPVSGRNGTATTVVVPDVVNGLFLLKVNNQ